MRDDGGDNRTNQDANGEQGDSKKLHINRAEADLVLQLCAAITAVYSIVSALAFSLSLILAGVLTTVPAVAAIAFGFYVYYRHVHRKKRIVQRYVFLLAGLSVIACTLGALASLALSDGGPQPVESETDKYVLEQARPSIRLTKSGHEGEPGEDDRVVASFTFENSGGTADNMTADPIEVAFVDARTGERIYRELSPPPPMHPAAGQRIGTNQTFGFSIVMARDKIPENWIYKWRADAGYIEISGVLTFTDILGRQGKPQNFCSRFARMEGLAHMENCARYLTPSPTSSPDARPGLLPTR